jgi:DNA-binding protein Fis
VDVKRELDSLVTQMHSSGISYEEAVRDFKKQYLREVLVAHRGNQCKAAEEMGMHRNTRPPRSERPVYSVFRQGYRQG